MDFIYEDAEVIAGLQRLLEKTGNIKPALTKIGEALAESTKQRFGIYTGPDDVMWEANSDVTYERKADRSGIPLTDQGTLADSIRYQLEGDFAVEIGSNLDQAAMMQFGGTVAEFPHLWGDIPARPYLGVSTKDRATVLNIIDQHLIL